MSTEASLCYKKVLLSSDSGTVQLVYLVAPFDTPSRRGNRCNHCNTDTATWDILVADIFSRSTTQPHPHQPSLTSQPAQGDSLDGSPLPNCSTRDIAITERDKQLSDLRRVSAMALPASFPDTPPRGQRALEELSVVTCPGPSFAVIVAVCCLQKSPKVRWKRGIKTAATALGGR